MKTFAVLILLPSTLLADLLCAAGENNGCAWHCGLTGKGNGICTTITIATAGAGSGEVLPPSTTISSNPAATTTDPREESCLCEASKSPVVTGEYFSQELEQVTNATQPSGLPNFIQQVVFLQVVRSYLFRTRESLLDPASYGLERATNFYIQGRADDDILGAWFMWPEGGFSRPRDLPEDSTLVVYFHGNSQDRGFGHRVGIIQSL